MEVERSLGEAPRLGVLDRRRMSLRPISIEVRCGKLGDRGYEPTGVIPGSEACELDGSGVPCPDLSEMALLASAVLF